jgi:hypothetical protein
MRFSKYFNITKSENDDWFDPILDYDTKLFIDPFLIFKRKHKLFKKSHSRIIEHFTNVFNFAAQSPRSKSSSSYKRLINLNKYPEVHELCLGYSGDSTKGAGSGSKFSDQIVQAIFNTIDLGLESLKHFEELGIFHKGIGADRISDITANIIKLDLVNYTNSVCLKHSIPTEITRIRVLNNKNEWDQLDVKLPTNPFSKKRILLIPEIFLNNIPEINDEDFYKHCLNSHSDELRTEFNTNVLSKLRKEQIIEIATNHRNWVREFLEFKEATSSNGYDLNSDPLGIYQWVIHSDKVFQNNPFKIVGNDLNSFYESIEKLIDEFKLYIEENRGFKLLWNEFQNKGKPEEAAQLLFYGVSKLYCKYSEIDITREAELGRGPVDFKFSNGYSKKILLELKLARNTRFWSGLIKQLPSYLKSESVSSGYFMIICYDDKDLKKIKPINEIVAKINCQYSFTIKVIVIDACDNKLSASNIKDEESKKAKTATKNNPSKSVKAPIKSKIASKKTAKKLPK